MKSIIVMCFCGFFLRTLTSELPTVDETTQFLAKQEILWKGFLNMLSVAKFVSKGYLVSGSAENLKTVKNSNLTVKSQDYIKMGFSCW